MHDVTKAPAESRAEGEEGPTDLHTAVRPEGVGIKQRTPSSKKRRKMMRKKRRAEEESKCQWRNREFYNRLQRRGGHVWR